MTTIHTDGTQIAIDQLKPGQLVTINPFFFMPTKVLVDDIEYMIDQQLSILNQEAYPIPAITYIKENYRLQRYPTRGRNPERDLQNGKAKSKNLDSEYYTTGVICSVEEYRTTNRTLSNELIGYIITALVGGPKIGRIGGGGTLQSHFVCIDHYHNSMSYTAGIMEVYRNTAE